MKYNIEVQPIKKSKIYEVDFKDLSFGTIFSDYMFECDCVDGKWENPVIKPYGPLTIDPSARVFHYGQAFFEGMKAYKDNDDNVFLFRPQENFKRFNKSAKRLAMPEVPEDLFFEGLKKLLNLEIDWIKKGLGNSLYIRPFMIATENTILASPSNRYKFIVICSPSQAYYSGEVRVLFAEKYSRAASGGVGHAKFAGNYAAQFYPTKLAQEQGFQQVVWTDASTHSHLEEAGTMNIFFRIGDTLLTPPISDRILDGVTRKSIIQLAEDNGIEIIVRDVSVSEIKKASKNGSLKEIFGSGTATVVNPILGFQHQGERFELPETDNSYGKFFKEKLLNIQYNLAEDPYQWRVKI